jgi:hypothetical protein
LPCLGHQPSPVPGHLPWDFRPFDVVSSWSPLTRVCLARYVPLPGFRNLLAACSSSNLAGLFHPADIPGILSSRAFSSTPAVAPRRCPMPSCRCLPAAPPPRFRAPVCESRTRGKEALDLSVFLGRTGRDLATDFRALLRCRARSIRSSVTPHGPSMLSWTFSSLGSAVPRRWSGFRRTSSRASAVAIPGEGLRACLHSGVLLVRGRGFLSLESAFPF